MNAYLLYVYSFCRFVIVITFVISFIGKARDFQAFERAIVDFDLLPHRLTRGTSLTVLASEISVVLFLVIGREVTRIGLMLAITQLTIFSAVLITVSVQRIQTSCNCFGSDKKPVSFYDLVRNGGLIIFALIGLLSSNTDPQLSLSYLETSLTAIMAIPLVMIWINLDILSRYLIGEVHK